MKLFGKIFFFTIPLIIFSIITIDVTAQRMMESLDRGVVAVRNQDGKVFISWRLLGTEPKNLAFNLYKTVNGKTEKLNKSPITTVTHFIDAKTDTTQNVSYYIKSLVKGK